MAAAAPLIERVSRDVILTDPDSTMLFAANMRHLVASDTGAKMVEVDAEYANHQFGDDEDEEQAAFWPDDDDWMAQYRPYVVKAGVLQIPIMGSLVNRMTFQFGRWATGYKYIEMAIKRGMKDHAVKGVALVVDSPGGEVSGLFELTDMIHAFRGEKPLRAYVADSAYSAAYALASAADSISVTRSGGVGSIGVIRMHTSVADLMANRGIEVTAIYRGEHKLDGHPNFKLSKQAKARFQARVDKLYGVFTETVARNRNMDDKDVRATEASSYDADEAIETKLADNVGTLEEGLLTFAAEMADAGDIFMGQKPNDSGETVNTVTATQNDADVKAAEAKGFAAAQTRINEIMALDEAKGRETTAMHFATTNALSVVEVKAALATMPVQAEAPKVDGDKDKRSKDHFAENMDKGGSPNVGASDDDDGGEQATDPVDQFWANMGQPASVQA